MNNNSKKISFSFSKTKKPFLVKKIEESKETVDFVSSFDNAEKKPKSDKVKELIIPLVDSRNCQEVLKNRVEKKKKSKKLFQIEAHLFSASNDNCKKNFSKSIFDEKLTKLAEAEILNNVQNTNEKLHQSYETVIQQEKIVLEEQQENNKDDIDYELVPVTDFGLAMLRGMGWKPSSGIGKNPRVISATSPKLRPKGLGLGVKNNFESHSEPNS